MTYREELTKAEIEAYLAVVRDERPDTGRTPCPFCGSPDTSYPYPATAYCGGTLTLMSCSGCGREWEEACTPTGAKARAQDCGACGRPLFDGDDVTLPGPAGVLCHTACLPAAGSRPYHAVVYLDPEAAGGYSVYAADLPGCVSQGDTAAEALTNIGEAFAAILGHYAAIGTAVPWRTVPPREAHYEMRMITVTLPAGIDPPPTSG